LNPLELDIERGRTYTIADVSNQLGEAVETFLESNFIEENITVVSNFITDIFQSENANVNTQSEASIQGMIRAIFTALQNVAVSFYEAIISLFIFLYELFLYLCGNIYDYLIALSKQDWTNITFSCTLVVLISCIFSMSYTQYNYQVLNDERFANFTTMQVYYKLSTDQQIEDLNQVIVNLQTMINQLQTNDTSTFALNLRLNDLESQIDSTIQGNLIDINDQINNISLTFDDKINSFQDQFFSQNGIFTQELEYARQNASLEMLDMHTTLDSAIYSFDHIEKNVTGEISHVNNLINTTISALNTMILNAKSELKKILGNVENDVKKYENETNNNFSDETNFVKYQLAGWI
jgi:hypothetical protein